MKAVLILAILAVVPTAFAQGPPPPPPGLRGPLPAATNLRFTLTKNADGSLTVSAGGLTKTVPASILNMANTVLTYVQTSISSLPVGKAVPVNVPITINSDGSVSVAINGKTYTVTAAQLQMVKTALGFAAQLFGPPGAPPPPPGLKAPVSPLPTKTINLGFTVTKNSDGSLAVNAAGQTITVPATILNVANTVLTYVQTSISSLPVGKAVAVNVPITVNSNGSVSVTINGKTYTVTAAQLQMVRTALGFAAQLLGPSGPPSPPPPPPSPTKTTNLGFTVTKNADGSLTVSAAGLTRTVPASVLNVANTVLTYVQTSISALPVGKAVSVNVPITINSDGSVSVTINGTTYTVTAAQLQMVRTALGFAAQMFG